MDSFYTFSWSLLDRINYFVPFVYFGKSVYITWSMIEVCDIIYFLFCEIICIFPCQLLYIVEGSFVFIGVVDFLICTFVM